MSALIERLAQEKIIGILRGISVQSIELTAKALAMGGITFLEITLDSTGALDTITRFRNLYEGKLHIGAGTVLDLEMAKASINAGAEYLISPNLNEHVIQYGLNQGVEVWPGVMTPTEIVRAHELGVSAVKVFPSGSLGIKYLKDIREPLSHIRMIATGGVNLDNIQDILHTGAFAVGIGGGLVKKEIIQQGNFDELGNLAKLFVSHVKGVS